MDIAETCRKLNAADGIKATKNFEVCSSVQCCLVPCHIGLITCSPVASGTSPSVKVSRSHGIST